MAINLFNKYGSRANPPSIDYPEGSIKNRSAPDVKDGTPLDADWANDHQGFFQSILSYFGVTSNGTPDKVGASQYFDALFSNPTETLRGMPLKATDAEVQAGTNASKMVTPASLRSAYELPLGQGQTWQDVTSSRVIGTTYTNSTGRTIALSIVRTNSTTDFETGGFITVGGKQVSYLRLDNEGATAVATITAIVPSGQTYKFDGAGSNQTTTWWELR